MDIRAFQVFTNLFVIAAWCRCTRDEVERAIIDHDSLVTRYGCHLSLDKKYFLETGKARATVKGYAHDGRDVAADLECAKRHGLLVALWIANEDRGGGHFGPSVVYDFLP